MELEHVWTLALVFLSAVLLYYFFRKHRDNYPPGPWPLPIVGNVHQIVLSGSIMNFCQKNREKYGDVFTAHIGGLKRVVLSGYDNFYKVLIKNAEWSSIRNARAVNKLSMEHAAEMPGIFWAPYPHWKKLRTFAISTLREEGMGKASMEPKMLDELECYLDHFIKPNIGKPIQIINGLKLATNNIISQMVFGRRSSYDDINTKSVIDGIAEILSLTSKLSFLTNMPLIGRLRKSLEDRCSYLMQQVITPVFTQYINEHKSTLDANSPRDVVDRFLLHSQTLVGEDKRYFSDKNLMSFCAQLYSAGYESTANVLVWALLYMCLHVDIQERVQEEIDTTIGVDRYVTTKDRRNLPLTDAVLLETLRKANIAPVAAPHTLEKEMVIDGKTVPAGADILLNMTSVMYDETVFEEPDKFYPDRYLTGDIASKKQRTIPFSMGRRGCAGESLAKMEIFMFFVSFLQRYDVRLPNNSQTTDKPLCNGQGNFPQPFDIIFTSRQ